MEQKRVFRLVLAALAIMLMLLPFLVQINEILTKLVESVGVYVWVQEKVVPVEVKMVGALVSWLGVEYTAHPDGFTVNGVYARLTWNCIGWQSLLLFGLSLPFGFKAGRYTAWSKLEATMIGLVGTFLVNLMRMAVIVLILAVSRPLFAVVFHDYLAAVVTVVWLVVFWWFCYGYVLEERDGSKRI